MIDRLTQLFDRLGDYAFWQVALELGAIWLVVYAIVRFVRGTRAAGALIGLLSLVFVTLLFLGLLAQLDIFPRLTVLIDKLLGVTALALIVVFAPEIRRAGLRIGENLLMFSGGADVSELIDALVKSSRFLSKNKFGAIIAIERKSGLRELIEAGKPLNADVSEHLIKSIFWPNSPLHDMGVVIRGDKIVAASVPFPLIDPGELPDEHLGTRHRAALGLARQSDAIIVVVSEETGAISLAEGRDLDRWLTPDALRAELEKRLGQRRPPQDPTERTENADAKQPKPPKSKDTGAPRDNASDGSGVTGALGGVVGG